MVIWFKDDTQFVYTYMFAVHYIGIHMFMYQLEDEVQEKNWSLMTSGDLFNRSYNLRHMRKQDIIP